jgi:hypothetical protein
MTDSGFPRRHERARRHRIATRETHRCHQHRSVFACGRVGSDSLDAPVASTVDQESII